MFACGQDFTLMITTSDEGKNPTGFLPTGNIVIGCGNNKTHSLGLPTQTNIVTPQRIAPLNNIIMVSAGIDHSLALDINGDVWGWGSNEYYKLGISEDFVERPIKLPLENIIKIACGEHISLAVDKNGGIWWAGDIIDDNIGPQFKLISVVDNIIDISAGSYFGLILTSHNEVFEFYSDGIIDNPVINNIVKIGCNSETRIALTNEGNVYIWGKNQNKELAPEMPEDDYSSPTLHTRFTNIINISTGLGPLHLINSQYQVIKLSDKSTYISSLFNSLFNSFYSRTSPKNNYIAIASGGTTDNYHVVAQTFYNQLCGWGNNSNYQLGSFSPPLISASSPSCFNTFIWDTPEESPNDYIYNSLGINTTPPSPYFSLPQQQHQYLTKNARKF